jgi:hypothetical protein
MWSILTTKYIALCAVNIHFAAWTINLHSPMHGHAVLVVHVQSEMALTGVEICIVAMNVRLQHCTWTTNLQSTVQVACQGES